MANRKSTQDRSVAGVSDKRAEEILIPTRADVAALPPDEVQRLVDDLQMHQIELQMQGEELRRAQTELAISHDRYTDLYDFSPIGYLSLDLDGKINGTNLTAARLLGLERNRLVGGWFSTFVVPKSQGAFLGKWQEIITSMSDTKFQLKLRRLDGYVFDAQLDFLCRLEETNPGERSVLSEIRIGLVDVTDQNRIKEKLEEADQKKDEFIAMLAHELRTPMAAINAAVRLLFSPNIDQRKQILAKESLESRVNQLKRLVDDLLDISSLDRGRIRLDMEQHQIEAIVEKAVEAVQWSYEKQRQHLAVTFVDRPAVYADSLRLEQIVSNLLINASRYSNAEQEIQLCALRDGNEVVISVSDNGIGICETLLPEIFEPFQQGPDSIARAKGGLGLGLSIAKMLAEMHGGSISARSEGRGKGSEFILRLPIAEKLANNSATTAAISRQGLRILLVEDQVDTAAMEAAMLEDDGHLVEIANDGPSAVGKALKMKPDVILLDIGLPGYSGYEVAERVRAESSDGVMIVAITGYGRMHDAAMAQKCGIDHCLVKPVDRQALMSLLYEHSLR